MNRHLWVHPLRYKLNMKIHRSPVRHILLILILFLVIEVPAYGGQFIDRIVAIVNDDIITLSELDFIIEPYIRFKGEVGEQATMFFLDPSGNAIEFKSFKDFARIFAV